MNPINNGLKLWVAALEKHCIVGTLCVTVRLNRLLRTSSILGSVKATTFQFYFCTAKHKERTHGPSQCTSYSGKNRRTM